MGRLLYISNVSLDGYVEDADGSFEWSAPADDFFAFITDLLRPVRTYLYGRRMYETMAVWETDPSLVDQSALMADFAQVWQAADKVVVSSTLGEPLTQRTRVQRFFDPDAIQQLKQSGDLTVGGAHLAGQAAEAGLIDEYHLFVRPILLGGGKPALSGARLDLELLEEKRLSEGVVYLRHRVRRQ